MSAEITNCVCFSGGGGGGGGGGGDRGGDGGVWAMEGVGVGS